MGQSFDEPARSESEEVTLDGKRYVVLANTHEILAVYRIKPDGLLRRLRRWPKTLTAGVVG